MDGVKVESGVPIVDRVVAVCEDATYQDVVLDRLQRPKWYTWYEITGIDRTNKPDCIEVGVKRGRQFYTFRSSTVGAANVGVRLHGRTFATWEFVPCARIWGATLGDELELIVNGYEGHL